MGKPIATTAGGVCVAFPNVCKTPVPGSAPVPIPYPNIGQLSAAGGVDTVKAGGSPVINTDNTISPTTGSEAGSLGNASTGTFNGKVTFAGSGSVNAGGFPVVRLLDATEQNDGAAKGKVLGGFPTVLVGG
jgi:hypothetical protein